MMTGKDDNARTNELIFEYEFDAPPERVWQAVRKPEFRRRWLPDKALADPEPLSSVPGREVRYRMRDGEPPFLESIVTFRIEPGADDGTRLAIVHRLIDARLQPDLHKAANDNAPCLMRAA